MIRWFRSLFAWRSVRRQAVWEYRENAITGRRAAVRIWRGGWSPLDWDWLDAGSGMPLIDDVEAWRSGYRDGLPDGRRWR